jgi:hypothetical protein
LLCSWALAHYAQINHLSKCPIFPHHLCHPRYKDALVRYGLDDAWRAELLGKVDALEPITGIHVSLDADY